MDELVFKKFVDYIYSECGITLKKGKEALLSARIQNRMRHLNITDYEIYLDYILKNVDEREKIELIDAISTNVTSFFREPEHFELLTKFLPRVVDGGIKNITIWSAACSSGEEPYTIAMTAQDALAGTGGNFRVLGTDISTKVLEKAKSGEYSEDLIEKVPVAFKEKYLKKYASQQEGKWQIAQQIRDRVTFSRINLSKPPFPMKGPFDVIFCRNVMIYFDTETRNRLVNEMVKLLRPGGLLMIGHSETLSGMQNSLTTIRASIYRKQGA